MGALTLKPSAYQARPWELSRLEVFNHYEGTGTLVFHLRGSRVIRVSQPGWMRDRIRFLYDGLKRQRLTQVYHRGHPVGWSTGLTYWLTLLGGGNYSFRVDPEGVYFFWLQRGYNFFRDGRLATRVAAVDTLVESQIFHGGFGLKPVELCWLALPGCLTPEEENVLTSPVGSASYFLTAGVLFQLFRAGENYHWGGLTTPGVDHPRGVNRSLFQVSPLQRLLSPEW